MASMSTGSHPPGRSSSGAGQDALEPGASDYTAPKPHNSLTAGVDTIADLTSVQAREHGSPHLQLDESWRGWAF